MQQRRKKLICNEIVNFHALLLNAENSNGKIISWHIEIQILYKKI